jgi:aldehyde:ferredoxin oxidoreductase
MDSVSVCQFVYGPAWQLYDTQQLIHMIQHVTGWELDVEELLEIGARRLNLMQTYNAREGFTRKDDQLPKKLFKPLQGGASEGYALSPPKVERVKNMYYQLAGWDEETAKPTDERLTELGLAWVLNLPELS